MDTASSPTANAAGIASNKQDPGADVMKSDGQQQQSSEFDRCYMEESSPVPELSLSEVLEGVDRFVVAVSTTNDKSKPLEIRNCVQSLFKMVEKKIAGYDTNKFGQNPDEDSSFFECSNRIFKLMDVLDQFKHDPKIASCLNRAGTVMYLVLSLLDSEFRYILDSCNRNINNNSSSSNTADSKTPKASKAPSFTLHHQDSNRTAQPEPELEEFPAYSQESITIMNKMATLMISLGYEKECCMAYHMARRHAFNTELEKLGFNNIGVEDMQKMQWDALEGEIAVWNDVFKHCYSVLIPSEQKLCDSIFSDYPSISQRMSSDIAFSVTIRFLNFAEAVALTRRSAEKLFKFLDMYETLRDIIPAIYSTDNNELKSETSTVKSRLGEAAVSIFCDLENSIRRDQSKIPVPSGAVHPLTRYTMNYLKYACEYKDTLEQIFLQHKMEANTFDGGEYNEPFHATEEIKPGANDDGTPKTSPFAVQLNMVMDLLDENLAIKSKLYKDNALKFVFLMNNGRYILQKIKGSDEINDIMGATWCRKRYSDLRKYHKGYTRETWGRLLQCLRHEGLQVNGKMIKPVLKERFKMFNSMFEEIHKTQSAWVVSDEQLQSELRVSVSAVVIPAYRTFLGRFQQYLSSGRQTEKYIKYQPEDIESLIDELFDGNPNSLVRRRT